ncbi:hypothetical protein Q5P01_006556 [Channa striata]|uniref:Uncharacterized protein n=1 Tax=Channa striata TaxID=64152 RepID=A0AA88T4I5_CHASR|nr:hypothetical protein Q5P01_006556 [Channa striata]
MDHLCTNVAEETKCTRGEEDEEEGEEEEGKQNDDFQTEKSSVQKQQRSAWAPCFFHKTDKDVYYYTGQKIVIEGAFDSYAGMTWPGALALSHYLDTHQEQVNLVDKAVLEIGAGTGLVSVVAALLGAWVTATDLPDVLNHLRVNLSRNTRGRSRHTPQVAALPWSFDLESSYPSSVYHYDYVLASDVVYHHDFLDELLATMKHFCKPGTTMIWANKVRLESDLVFTENFKKAFHVNLLSDDGEVIIFMATCREEASGSDEGLESKDMMKEETEETQRKEVKEEENREKHPLEGKLEDELHHVGRGKENDHDEKRNLLH